jgi:putative cell wall-binding protein
MEEENKGKREKKTEKVSKKGRRRRKEKEEKQREMKKEEMKKGTEEERIRERKKYRSVRQHRETLRPNDTLESSVTDMGLVYFICCLFYDAVNISAQGFPNCFGPLTAWVSHGVPPEC